MNTFTLDDEIFTILQLFSSFVEGPGMLAGIFLLSKERNCFLEGSI